MLEPYGETGAGRERSRPLFPRVLRSCQQEKHAPAPVKELELLLLLPGNTSLAPGTPPPIWHRSQAGSPGSCLSPRAGAVLLLSPFSPAAGSERGWGAVLWDLATGSHGVESGCPVTPCFPPQNPAGLFCCGRWCPSRGVGGVSSAWDAGLGAACATTLPGTWPGWRWPCAAPWGSQIARGCGRGRGRVALIYPELKKKKKRERKRRAPRWAGGPSSEPSFPLPCLPQKLWETFAPGPWGCRRG